MNVLTTTKLKNPHSITGLDNAFRQDLVWWYIFLQSFNGFSILCYISLFVAFFLEARLLSSLMSWRAYLLAT